MKTKTILLAVITLLSITFAGCDKKQNDVDEIVFWHFWSEPYQRVEMNKLIEEFESDNNCKVIVSELSWNDGKSKLLTAFSSGTAPDVLELGSDWVAQFSSAGVLMELDGNQMGINNYVDFSQKPCYWDNKLYAMPWIVDTRVMFYNKDLLTKAISDSIIADNYDDLIRQVEEINQINDVYGFGANGSDEHRLYKKIIPMFWTFGGDVLDENGNPVVNSDQNLQALETYAELARYGMIETQRQLDAAFVRGEIGVWFSGGWLIEKIKNENPELNYDVAPVPNAKGKKGISFAGGEYFAVNNATNNPDLAKKFLNYITKGETAIRFCKKIIEAGFPADKNYYNDEFYQSFPKRMIFAEQLKNSKMTPVHPKWLTIEKIIEEKTVEVLYGEKEPKEALDEAQQEIIELLK